MIWCNSVQHGDLETVLAQKKGLGQPRKATEKTENLLKRMVISQPPVTSKELKAENPDVLASVSTRTIQHWL